MSDFLQRRFYEALLPLELFADRRGEWSLMLPVPSESAASRIVC